MDDFGNPYFKTGQLLYQLETSMDAIKEGVCALNRIVAEAGRVQDSFSENGADDDQRIHLKQIKVEAALLAIELAEKVKNLRQITRSSIDLPGDLRESIQLVGGDAA